MKRSKGWRGAWNVRIVQDIATSVFAMVVGAACSLAWTPTCFGQNLPAPRFPASAPETQEVVVEQIYRYRVRQFTPPVRVKLVAKSAANYSTPEDALIAQCSAMLTGDYEWWRAGWDSAGQETVAKRGAEYWKKNWRDMLSDRTFVLLQRAETEGAVIYEYELDPPPQLQALARGMLVFRQDNGRWAVTNSLENDPVFLWWTTPEHRGRMIMRKQ